MQPDNVMSASFMIFVLIAAFVIAKSNPEYKYLN